MTCHWTWLGEVRSSGLVGEHLERRSGRTWPALWGCGIPALRGASCWKTAAQPLTTLQLHHQTPVNNKHGLIFLQSNNTYNLIANCSATLSNTSYQQPMTQSLIDKWTVNTYIPICKTTRMLYNISYQPILTHSHEEQSSINTSIAIDKSTVMSS